MSTTVFNGRIITREEPQAGSTHLGSYLDRAQDRAVAGAAAAHRDLVAVQREQAKKLRQEERNQIAFLRSAGQTELASKAESELRKTQ